MPLPLFLHMIKKKEVLAGMETISAKELERLAADGGAVIIDLRSPNEYARGHVRGAVNVPQGNLSAGFPGRKDRPLVLYCERGALSMAVARELERRGYRTKSVVGGYRAISGGQIW